MGDQGVEVMKAASAADSGRAKAVSKVSKLVQGLITDLGEDVSRDGLLGTPQVLPTFPACCDFIDSRDFSYS